MTRTEELVRSKSTTRFGPFAPEAVSAQPLRNPMWWMTLWNEGALGVQWGVTIAASVTAVYFDISRRRIPNLLTGPVLVSGLIASSYCGGWAGLADAVAACVLVALPYVLLFLFAGGGAGDAKLMGALGAWLGLANGAIVLVAVALAGVVLGLGHAIAKKRLLDVLAGLKRIAFAAWLVTQRRIGWEESRQAAPPRDEMLTMPYAVAICVGVCLAAGGSYLWHG